jgi:hypothetical protein
MKQYSKSRRRRSVWTRPWIRGPLEYGQYSILLEEDWRQIVLFSLTWTGKHRCITVASSGQYRHHCSVTVAKSVMVGSQLGKHRVTIGTYHIFPELYRMLNRCRGCVSAICVSEKYHGTPRFTGLRHRSENVAINGTEWMGLKIVTCDVIWIIISHQSMYVIKRPANKPKISCMWNELQDITLLLYSLPHTISRIYTV